MNRLVKLIPIILILFCGCKSTTGIYSENDVKSKDFYFPLKTEVSNEEINCKLDTFQNHWYSKHLFSMNEPILFNAFGRNISVYRFTILRTWSSPITIRVEKNDSIVTITKKITNGKGGYKAGSLIFNKTKKLSISEWKDLKIEIDSISFWTMPTHVNTIGLDGEQWILEGVENNKYNFVTRWSPDHVGDSKFVKVCEFFEELFRKGK